MYSKLCDSLAAILQKRPQKIANADDYLQAAVTVPLVEVDGQLSVLFEVRSGQLTWQPGEICFPGGRIEASDENPVQAAVRETIEELCIERESIRVLGALDIQVSPIGVMIYPCSVQLNTVPEMPSADEVAEIFTVPLDYLLKATPRVAYMETATRPLDDFPFEMLPAGYPQGYRRRAKYSVLFFQYEKYVIWGITARVLSNFLDLCRGRLEK